MTSLKVLAIVAVLSPFSTLLVSASGPPDKTLDEIARHREWTQVTNPYALDPSSVAL
jgi:hypothetical protein